MRFGRRVGKLLLTMMLFMAARAGAQGAHPPAEPAAGAGQHDHMNMDMAMNDGWQLMQDGIVFAEFNHQGGPRGGNQFVV